MDFIQIIAIFFMGVGFGCFASYMYMILADLGKEN